MLPNGEWGVNGIDIGILHTMKIFCVIVVNEAGGNGHSLKFQNVSIPTTVKPGLKVA